MKCQLDTQGRKMQEDRNRYTSLGINFSFFCFHCEYEKHHGETQASDPGFDLEKNVYPGFLLSLMWWSGSTNLQPRCCRNPVCMFPFPGVNPCDSWGFMSYHPLHNHSFYHHHQLSQLLVYNPDLSFTKKTVLDMVKSWIPESDCLGSAQLFHQLPLYFQVKFP